MKIWYILCALKLHRAGAKYPVLSENLSPFLNYIKFRDGLYNSLLGSNDNQKSNEIKAWLIQERYILRGNYSASKI